MKFQATFLLLLLSAFSQACIAKEILQRPQPTLQIEKKVDELRDELHAQSNSSLESEKRLADLQKGLLEIKAKIEQPHEQDAADRDAGWGFIYPVHWFGQVFGAITAAIFVLIVAKYVTLKLKAVESMLEFTKRYGELMREQTEINLEHAKIVSRARAESPTALVQELEIEKEKAMAWWWRFFDLVLYEYDFFRNGLVWEERFFRWMKWKHSAFNELSGVPCQTSTMSYRDAWEVWSKTGPNTDSDFVDFMNEIHKADTHRIRKLVRKIRSNWFFKI